MVGIGDSYSDEIMNYLQFTQIWDYGNNGDWINDNRLIIKLNSIIHFFSFHNIYIHALIFSFISFLGIHYIYRAFSPFVVKKKIFWYTLILWPSLAFWGGSMMKETILIFATGLYFYYLFKWLKNRASIKLISILTIAILILLFNKPYAGLFIIAFSLVYIFGTVIRWQKKGLLLISAIILVVATFFLNAPTKINLTHKISGKQIDLNNLAEGGIAFTSDSAFCVFPYQSISHFEVLNAERIKIHTPTKGTYKLFGKKVFYPFEMPAATDSFEIYLIYEPTNSFFKTKLINYSVSNLIQSIPQAIVNVIIRPFPWDNGDKLKIVNFISNLILLFSFFYAILFRKKLTNHELYLQYILIGISLFIVLIIGLSTPIFGAIVRYKVPAELFIIISIFIMLKPKHENKSTV